MVKSTLLLSLAGAAFGMAALTGCGSDGGNTAGNGDGGGGPSTRNVADDKAELAFAKCMREHGIDVSDPDGSGRLQIRMRAGGGEGQGTGASPKKMQASMKECRQKTGGGPREPSEAEKTEMRDQALKFSKCMREHGVDMPDPEFEGGGGIKLTRRAGQRGLDPESPAFQKAQQACEDVMPMMRRGDGPSTTKSGSAGAVGGDDGGQGVDVEVPAP